MPACAYCSKPFIKTDEWHTKHPELVKHCSHGCLYAAELPNSHAGQSFVSLEAMGSALPDIAEQNTSDEVQECIEIDDTGSIENRFVSVIELLSIMNTDDRNLLINRIISRTITLKSYAKNNNITINNVNNRLSEIYKKHPYIESIINVLQFVAVIDLIGKMNAGDRDLLLYRIHNRNKTLAEYARKKDITVQAVHRRLVKMCKKHPCIEFAISEHRYRKRSVNAEAHLAHGSGPGVQRGGSCSASKGD